MSYFSNVSSLEELKKEYRKLVFIHHPDRGGNVKEMQELNYEYEKLFEKMKHKHNTDNPNKQTQETSEQFIEILEQLSKFVNIEIEIIGNWLWVSGNTYIIKDELRKFLNWSKTKKMWYWRADEKKNKWYKAEKSIEDIRSKYGSTSIKNKNNKSLKGA